MKIVHSFNKQNGVTYVYEVLEAHYNPEKKRSESTRRLIGKLDSNGNIVSTGKRGPQKPGSGENGESVESVKEKLRQLELSKREQDRQSQKLRSKLLNYLQEEQKRLTMIDDLIKRQQTALNELMNEI